MEPSTELAKILGPLLVTEEGETATTTSQATLFLARDLTGKEVVLKRTTARSREQLDSAQNEVSLLRKIRHPNVVVFYGVWFKPLQPYGTEVNLLMELCPGGHLLDLQRRREKAGRPLTEQEIVRLFVQSCRGVECLHRFDPPVAHRDVKLENLLLGGEDGRTVKLCDFGSATTRRTLVTSKEERARLEDEVMRLTTPSYRAPELVDFYSRKLVSEQVDVWALGCVLYALAYGKHAFGDEGSTLAILSGKFTIPAEPYYSPEFKLLFFWLLEDDPNIRPRIGDVVDELDMLLGNRIKVGAEKRGSGQGARASSKIYMLEQMQQQQQQQQVTAAAAVPTRTRKATAGTSAKAAVPARGAAFVTGVAKTTTITSSGPSRGAPPLPCETNQPINLQAPPSSTVTHSRGTRGQVMESRRSAAPSSGEAPRPSSTLVRASKPVSNNPFDDIPPSFDPTFFSTPGMSSNSVAGFPDVFSLPIPCPFDLGSNGASTTQLPVEPLSSQPAYLSSTQLHQMPFHVGAGSRAMIPHTASSATFSSMQPSQAPIFFSDPPPQWRTQTGL